MTFCGLDGRFGDIRDVVGIGGGVDIGRNRNESTTTAVQSSTALLTSAAVLLPMAERWMLLLTVERLGLVVKADGRVAVQGAVKGTVVNISLTVRLRQIGLRANKCTTQKEEDAVKNINNPAPTPVGEVRFY